jgi:hypothetical protein
MSSASHPSSLTVAGYFRTLTRLVGEPRRFFADRADETGTRFPLSFFLISAIISAGAAMAGGRHSAPMLGIFLINAVGMAVLAAGIGYMIMVMTLGPKASFGRFFSVYALASGVTLLASWVPFFAIITEPWKWWLIGVGMIQCLRLSVRQALWIIAVSVAVIVLGFWSALTLILPFGQGG